MRIHSQNPNGLTATTVDDDGIEKKRSKKEVFNWRCIAHRKSAFSLPHFWHLWRCFKTHCCYAHSFQITPLLTLKIGINRTSDICGFSSFNSFKRRLRMFKTILLLFRSVFTLFPVSFDQLCLFLWLYFSRVFDFIQFLYFSVLVATRSQFRQFYVCCNMHRQDRSEWKNPFRRVSILFLSFSYDRFPFLVWKTGNQKFVITSSDCITPPKKKKQQILTGTADSGKYDENCANPL